MFGKEEKEALLWTIVGEGNAHRMYGKKRMMNRSGETVTNENEEEEEEERFLLRRRKRRKREEDSCTTFLSSLSSSFDRFVWSNGRERDADDEKSVLQRDVRFALGQLCAGCAGGTIQTTKEAGNILFSEQQRLRVKWNTSLHILTQP